MKRNRFSFRVDASLQIGTGHVMRCLTLADALAARGADCEFICRAHEGNLIEFIRSKSYVVHVLPLVEQDEAPVCSFFTVGGNDTELAHGSWLGASQEEDVEACAQILIRRKPDWLIVDHYALDARWEQALAPYYDQLMVIDDLADREHVCALLLDQTFGRSQLDYELLVPHDCKLLCGSEYALLRPEFAELRDYSLQRRANPVMRELLVSMGGIDKDNVTSQVLKALRSCALPTGCRVTVVMGSRAPWMSEVHELAKSMPWAIRVLVDVANMAQLMADSDLAIGAAGSTSWERCCLGVPSIMLVLAENQRKIMQNLKQAGAALVIDSVDHIAESLREFLGLLINDPLQLQCMSMVAVKVIDGCGVTKVIQGLVGRGEYADQFAMQ